MQNIPPDDPRSGGGQRVHHALVNALRADGHDARGAFLAPVNAVGQAAGTPSPSLPYPSWSVPEAPRLLQNALRLRRLARRIATTWVPDVIYAAAPEAAFVFGATRPGALRIATSHHYDPPDLSAGLPWMRPLRAARQARSGQRFYLERHMLRTAELVLSPSKYGLSRLRDRGYLTSGTPAAVLRNGVYDDWFFDGAPESRSGFLFVGRLDTQKGVDVLLDALARTSGSWPLTVVGDGWQRVDLTQRARALGVEARVRWVGHADHAGVRAHMRDCGALLVSSRAENYPLVVLEGLASGIPVVATAVGGVPEMVRDGVSALLVDPDDAGALARAMDRVEVGRELRRGLAAEGRAVAEGHRWSAVARRLVELVNAHRSWPDAPATDR